MPFWTNKKKNLLVPTEVAPGLKVPKALADIWPLMEATKQVYVSIKAVADEVPGRLDSKLAHPPALPKGYTYPRAKDGKPLASLAQINFREVPPLPGFPTSGILQFYIAADDTYGFDFKDAFASDIKVLFFEESELTELEDNLSFLEEMEVDMLPVSKPYRLHFSLATEYDVVGQLGSTPAQKALYAAIEEKYAVVSRDLRQFLFSHHSGAGHKLGGQACFTQSDPRLDGGDVANFVLLFQLDSKDDMMWGDMGVGHFFIHPDALAKKDFSKVLYNWDCH